MRGMEVVGKPCNIVRDKVVLLVQLVEFIGEILFTSRAVLKNNIRQDSFYVACGFEKQYSTMYKSYKQTTVDHSSRK